MDIQSGRLCHFLLSDHSQRQQQDENCKIFSVCYTRMVHLKMIAKVLKKKEEWFESGVGMGA